MPYVSSFSPSHGRYLSLLLVLALVVACSGGGTYSVNEGRLAQRFMPTERDVPNHPDSLYALTVSEADGKVQFELESDYQALMEKWSCSFQSVGAGRPRRTPSFATLWSLELSLASLQPEMGILSLQEDRARQLIQERRREYFDSIQIDVYWFLEGRGDSGIVAGPGARTRLVVQDTTYRPIRTDHTPLRQAFLSGGGTNLYRRNTLHFPRTVDGRDILKDASRITLEVRRVGGLSTDRFSWNWEEGATAQREPEKVDVATTVFASHR